MPQTNKERRYRIKTEMIEKLGGKCSACGYNKSYSALCFHHRSPESKEFNISGTNLTKIAKHRIELEVAKCDLYCLNCHAETHDKEGWVHEDGKRTKK